MTAYWITGKKGSGKTTLAHKLADQIPKAVVLDADHFRAYMDFGYTPEGRVQNQTALAAFGRMLEDQDFVPIIACVSPVKEVRKRLQKQFEQCIEIQLPFGTLWEGTTYED
jgi:adenylylsulfate kinase-like enzyme